MEQHTTNKPPIKSADTTFRIIELIRKHDTVGVTQLAEELGLAKSTVHDHLTTLYSNEYLVKENGTYSLSLKFYDHGMYVRGRTEVAKASEPILADIARETHELVLLIVEEHGRAVYLVRNNGDATINYDRNGKRVPLHCIAGGKAILSHYSLDRVEDIIARHGLEKCTEQTIDEPTELFEELRSIRETGYAINNEESKNGLRAVAAPIFDEDDVIAALSVSGPVRRLSMRSVEEEIVPVVQSATNEIELKLSYGND